MDIDGKLSTVRGISCIKQTQPMCIETLRGIAPQTHSKCACIPAREEDEFYTDLSIRDHQCGDDWSHVANLTFTMIKGKYIAYARANVVGDAAIRLTSNGIVVGDEVSGTDETIELSVELDLSSSAETQITVEAKGAGSITNTNKPSYAGEGIDAVAQDDIIEIDDPSCLRINLIQ
jgi:hypothetical protein